MDFGKIYPALKDLCKLVLTIAEEITPAKDLMAKYAVNSPTIETMRKLEKTSC
ncbi:MAG: hypothetical protein MZV64_37460 [Ignavibacteriales bacterium]|nr:hypothetical protein [Ignavibacteriales bacterium]